MAQFTSDAADDDDIYQAALQAAQSSEQKADNTYVGTTHHAVALCIAHHYSGGARPGGHERGVAANAPVCPAPVPALQMRGRRYRAASQSLLGMRGLFVWGSWNIAAAEAQCMS